MASFNLRRNNAIYLFYVVCFVKKVYIIFSLKQGLIDRENSCHVYYYSRTCHNHHLKSLDKIGCKIGPSRFKQYNLNLVFYQIYSFGFICIAQENNFYMEIDSLSLFMHMYVCMHNLNYVCLWHTVKFPGCKLFIIWLTKNVHLPVISPLWI